MNSASRITRLTLWTLRDPVYWRVALLVFLVILFSLVSGVSRLGCGGTLGSCGPPEQDLGLVLDFTAAKVVRAAYPFLFPLLAILVTLAVVVQRDAGGLAALQALGFRRVEILLSQNLAIFVLALVAGLVAFVALPPIVEPRLIGLSGLLVFYPLGYWASMPRLFLAILFIMLFAATFAILLRRPATALGAMITFFFVGWYLESQLGRYEILTPSGAFGGAWDFNPPLEGIPVDPNYVFVLYLLAASVAFLTALLYANRRGELQ